MAFEHYLAVRDGRRLPRFLVSRTIAASGDGDPWEQHKATLSGNRGRYSVPTPQKRHTPTPQHSLLDLKISLADGCLDACDLCPHLCRVDRNRGEAGYCGVGAAAAVHWEGVLCGEELPLVPSHEVFFSGCTMRCAFCYSHEHITRPMSGRRTAPAALAACAEARRGEGAANLNLVGGEPTVHLPTILRALRLIESPVPVVWNSNMYATPRATALLDGVVDVFLGDIHFGSEECARKLGRIPEYLPSVTAAFEAAVRSGADVVIRHLVMPGHVDCCARPAMEWAAGALPDTPFHLMFQYLPDYRAEGDPVLGRTLSAEERRRCLKLAQRVGVRLYRDEPNGPVPHSPIPPFSHSPAQEAVGDTVDLLVHPDGRVSFTRLLEGLIPIAAALNGEDTRVTARGGGNGQSIR